MARIALLFTLASALTVALMGGAVLWLFTLSSHRILDNHLMAYADIIIAQVKIVDGKVTMNDPGGVLNNLPRYWQVSEGRKPLFKSDRLAVWMPVRPDEPVEPQPLAWLTPDGKDIVALQATFLFPQGRKITLVSGLDRDVAEAYRQQERDALAAPLYRVMAVAAVALALFSTLFLLLALRPLARIVAALRAVQEGQAARIEGRFPDEIAALAAEINRLLDYMQGTVRRHRDYAANLAHALKTPLTVAANESDPKILREKLRGMSEIIDRSLARLGAVGAGGGVSSNTAVLPVATDIAEGFGKLYQKQVEISIADNLVFAGDRADLFEIAGNIIENACKFAAEKVVISATTDALVIEDDGPGIPPENYAAVLARGVRLDEATPGHGIGLGVAQDIAALYSGHLQFEPSCLGGLKVMIHLPFRR
ncbi:MAG TPA: sensor histidine kinase [Patescibacteria group bacterium]|nr:sensor histidine kinase [Patescibacteria group bacterium]